MKGKAADCQHRLRSQKEISSERFVNIENESSLLLQYETKAVE